MSWEIGAGVEVPYDDLDDDLDDDNWWSDEHDLALEKLLEEEKKRRENEISRPPCDYNVCLVGFVKSLAEKGVQFKVFGGAAYVHYACGDESAVKDPYAACRTHDVDLYLRDTEDNKKKFADAFAELQDKHRFDGLTETRRDFGGRESMVQIKWRAKVDSGDDARPVEHGIDVHYVGDDLENSLGRSVRLWDDWDRLPVDHRHFVTKEQLCDSLQDMVEGEEASSMDGENKGERRGSRYTNLCSRRIQPPIDAGVGLSLTSPYGGAFPKGAGLKEVVRRFTTRVAKEEAKKMAERAGDEVVVSLSRDRSPKENLGLSISK